MKPEETVALAAEKLAIGQVVRTKCPFCGRDEKGFRIARYEDSVHGKCYHAKCHQSILISGNKVISNPRRATIETLHYNGMPPTLNLTLPSSDLRAYIEDKYYLSESSLALIRYEPTLNALVYPLFDYYSAQIGHEVRPLDDIWSDEVDIKRWEQFPKTKLEFYKGEQCLHYDFTDKTGDSVVVVEDWFSAASVGRLTPSVALMGTSMSPSMVRDLRKHYKNVAFMLDYDALKVAGHMVREYGILFHKAEVVVARNDPKYISKEELRNLLRGFTS